MFSRKIQVHLIYPILICIYVLLLIYQLHLPPFERYPGWDAFWEDSRIAGELISFKHSLANFELPIISPYVNFGWNFAGDPKDPPSYFSPFSYLVLLFSIKTVMVLRLLFFLMMGGLGAYFFLDKIIRNKLISFLGGLTYIGLPILLITEFFYFEPFHIFYLFPFLLLILHSLFENPSFKTLFLFLIFCVFTISSGNIYTLLMLPSVVFFYTLFIGRGYYRCSLITALKKAAGLTFLCLLSGAFYIVPLMNNLKDVASALQKIELAGIFKVVPNLDLKSFLTFFSQYNYGGLLKPNQSHGLLIYIPIFFHLVIIFSLVFWKSVFKNITRAIIPVTLIFLGILMFGFSLLYYSIPGLSANESGASYFRHQINLVPFLFVLAGFICLSYLGQIDNKKLKTVLFLSIIVLSFSMDVFLFFIKKPLPVNDIDYISHVSHQVTAPFKSSNRFSIHLLKDMWPVLPISNAFFLFFLIFAVNIQNALFRKFKTVLSVIVLSTAVIYQLFSVSLHNDLRLYQNISWQWLTNNPHQWTSYQKRKAFIDGLVNRSDRNFRTLYVGGGANYTSPNGRDRKILAETELNVEDREKALFARRQIDHPYVGLMLSTFYNYFWRANFWPPRSDMVPSNLDTMRLMGIKYVISAEAMIEDPHLIFRGMYESEKGPLDPGEHEGGAIYCYELTRPMRIAFLADRYRIRSDISSLKTIYENREHPWIFDTVDLEMSPYKANELSVSAVDPPKEDTASIVSEGFNSFDVHVSAGKEKYLVISYVYRPHWKASVNSHDLTIYRAFGNLLCVKVPPGTSVIKFKYVPFDLYRGLLFTLISFLIPVIFIRFKFSLQLVLLAFFVFIIIGLNVLGTRTGSLKKAQAHFANGHYKRSLNIYERLTKNNQNSDLLFKIGECHEGLGQDDLAADFYEKYRRSTGLNVHDDSIHIKLGDIYSRQKKYDRAEAEFKEAINAKDSTLSGGYQGLVSVYLTQKKYGDAVLSLRSWQSLSPENFEPNWLLGSTYYLEGRDLDASIHFLQRCILLGKEKNSSYELSLAHYTVGQAYSRLGKVEESIDHFAEAYKLNSKALNKMDEREQNIVFEALAFEATRQALLNMDFSSVIMEKGNAFALAKSGQKLKIEGPINLTEGIDKSSKGIQLDCVQACTRVYGPTGALKLKEGALSIWARLDNINKPYSDLVRINNSNDLYIYFNGSEKKIFVFFNGNKLGNVPLITTDTNWHHYVFTWKKERQDLYMDGIKIISGRARENLKETSLFAIGWLGSGNGENWGGAISRLMTFDRPLQEYEIRALFKSGLIGKKN